jgi:transposase
MRMCQDAGVILAYLPPYSPDLNPIEESFAQLKQWIKKNRVLAEQFGDDFSGFLTCGLEAIQSSCKGHFSKCQIGHVEPRNDDDMEGDIDEELDEHEYY